MLPTVDSILRNATDKSWFGDMDLGEMFLNYPLDKTLQPYAGVDVTQVVHADQSSRSNKQVLEQWRRMLMGFKPSPYVTTLSFAWSEELVIGNCTNPNNPFFWDRIIMNLPGQAGYDSSMPWIYKWNSVQKHLPGYFGIYIDNIRTVGSSELHCFKETRQAASRINFLGQQDAARKRGQPSQRPRPWAGAKCWCCPGIGIFVLATQQKWDKAKGLVDKLIQEVIEEEALKMHSSSHRHKCNN